MKLIADSGSTKTDWVIAGREILNELKSPGLNPRQLTTDQIEHSIQSTFPDNITNQKIDEIYFYGAGCSTPANCEKIGNSLKLSFPNAHNIYIGSDLLAAARALFAGNNGLACILGTGSNSGLYNGCDIIKKVPSLGYIIGDEGSGAYIGKLFLRDLIYERCPAEYQKAFLNEYSMDTNDIIDRVYRKDNVNTFLSSLSLFVTKYNKIQYFYDLIFSAFNDFVNYHILPYEEHNKYAIGFVGSISYYNDDIMVEVLNKHGLLRHKTYPSPISKLIEFHMSINSLE